MTVGQLIEHLSKLPLDLKVWVSDAGYVEGANPCVEPKEVIAWEAGLNGDLVEDEWIYDKMDFYWKNQGYEEVEHSLLSKKIVLIKSTLDK